MKSTPNVPSLIHFLNDEEIPTLKNAGKKIKTNASFISSQSDKSKIRIGTMQKDYSFVNLNKQTIEVKEQLEQQYEGTKPTIPSIREQGLMLQDTVKESYLNWMRATRHQMIQNMGRKSLKQYKQKNHQQKEQNHNYFLVQISAISDIYWHAFQTASSIGYEKSHLNQLYCRMVISMVEYDEKNPSNPISFPKKIITQMIRLERRQKKDRLSTSRGSSHYYVTDEKFSVYFHSNKENIGIKIDLILYEVKNHRSETTTDEDQVNVQTQMVIFQQCFSSVEISMNDKTKQSTNPSSLYAPRQSLMHNLKKQLQKYSCFPEHNLLILNQQKNVTNTQQKKQFDNFGLLHYKVVNSKYYHLLEKFIPSQFLVTYQDLIPGILGGHLPKVDDMLFQLTPSTQAKSLNLQPQTLQLQTEWLQMAKQKAKFYFQNQASNNLAEMNKKQHIQFGHLKLSSILHNGLIEVSKASCELFEIMQIQKKTPYELQKSTSIHQLPTTQRNTNLTHVKIFSSSLLTLPVVFSEPNIFIILQIQQQAKLRHFDQKNNNQQLSAQQILIPVGFAFFEVTKIVSNKHLEMRFFPGWYLDEKLFTLFLMEKQKNVVLQSFNNLLLSRPQISTSRSKFLVGKQSFSKISFTFSLAQPKYDLFWAEDKTKKQDGTNKNFPGLSNRSILPYDQMAKIEAQKQKFLKKVANSFNNQKQTKKQITKKIKVRDEFVMIENPERLYILANAPPSANVQKRQISELKAFLNSIKSFQTQNNKVNKQTGKEQKSILVKMLQLKDAVKSQLTFKKLFKYVYEKDDNNLSDCFVSYKELSRQQGIKTSVLSQLILSWYPHTLYRMFSTQINNKVVNPNPFPRSGQFSSFMMMQNRESSQDYSYQKIPIQILRTQLTEINYNYLILINPLSIKPLQKSNMSLYAIPNKFFIKIYFWNMESQTSPCFQIDPSNGEIFVYQNKLQQNTREYGKNIPKSTTNHASNFRKSVQKQNSLNHIKQRKKQNQQQYQSNFNQQKQQKDPNKLKLKKVFHFQYGFEQQFANSHALFIDFIEYLYNGLMEIRLYDQFQEIGRTFFRLRSLIRKRKNEASYVVEQMVHSKQGPICTMKLECKSLRKQRQEKNLKNVNDQQKVTKPKNESANKQIPTQLISEQSNVQKSSILNSKNSELSQTEKQQQRIERFKKMKEQQSKSNIKSIEQKPNRQQESINRLIDKNYVTSEYKLKVYPLKQHLLIINLENKSGKKGFFYIKVTDNDQQIYNKTYPEPQFKIITDFYSQIDHFNRQKILAVPANKEKLLKYKKLSGDFQVQLEEKEKLAVVCQYFSYRTYRNEKELQKLSQKDHAQMLKVFNHVHTITVSLLQAASQSVVSSISKIHIIPEPQQTLMRISQVIKKDTKAIVPLPFLFSSIVTEKYDIYINQNKCNILYQDFLMEDQDEEPKFKSTSVSQARRGLNHSNRNYKTYMIESPKALMDMANNNLLYSPKGQILPTPKGKMMIDFINEDNSGDLSNKKVIENVSMFGQKVQKSRQQEIKSTMRKNRQMNMTSAAKNFQNKREKYVNFTSLLVHTIINDVSLTSTNNHDEGQNMKNTEINCFQLQNQNMTVFMIPKQKNYKVPSLNLQISIDQIDQQEVMKLPLFQPVKSTLKIPHHLIPLINGRKPKTIGLISSHPQFKPTFQWIEIDYQNKSYTEVTFNFTSTVYGQTSFHLTLIDPLSYVNFHNSFIGNSQANLQELTKSYLNKILFNIITPFPPLKAQLTINLPYNQSFVNEPFVYSNSSQFNNIFHTYSSHPYLVSFAQKDKISEIKAKTEKRFSLKINVKAILSQYLQALQSYIEANDFSGITEESEKQLAPTVVVGMVSDRYVEHFGFQFIFR